MCRAGSTRRSRRPTVLPRCTRTSDTFDVEYQAEIASANTDTLGKLAGAPAIWSDVMLHSGQLGALSVWLVEDAAGPPDQGSRERLEGDQREGVLDPGQGLHPRRDEAADVGLGVDRLEDVAGVEEVADPPGTGPAGPADSRLLG